MLFSSLVVQQKPLSTKAGHPRAGRSRLAIQTSYRDKAENAEGLLHLKERWFGEVPQNEAAKKNKIGWAHS